MSILRSTEFKSNHPLEPPTHWNATMHNKVLWIRGCPVAKCDPLLGRATQHDPEVAQWATQLLISGNMIKKKKCKFCVNNWKNKCLLKMSQNDLGDPVFHHGWATHEFELIHSTDRLFAGNVWISPREPHPLAWGPSNSHAKIFRVERARLKTGVKIVGVNFAPTDSLYIPLLATVRFASIRSWQI